MTNGGLLAARLEDAPRIATIHRLARAAAMPWLPVMHTPDEDLAYFREEVLPSHSVRIYAVAQETVGFVAWRDDWLNHLYVHPDHWRAGIGAHLLSTPMAASSQLQLWTFQKNAMARAFYGRHGFKAVEETDGAANEEKTPDVRLVWRNPEARA